MRMALKETFAKNTFKHLILHDDGIKWKHFPCYWPFVIGINCSPLNSPNKGQWHGALMFSLICTWVNSWINNREAVDLRCHHTNYDVTAMKKTLLKVFSSAECQPFCASFKATISSSAFDKMDSIMWILLTHWGRDKMATIFQRTFSNAFSWMNMYKFW